jgi:hypothetical protein
MTHNLSFRYHADMTTKGLGFAKVLQQEKIHTKKTKKKHTLTKNIWNFIKHFVLIKKSYGTWFDWCSLFLDAYREFWLMSNRNMKTANRHKAKRLHNKLFTLPARGTCANGIFTSPPISGQFFPRFRSTTEINLNKTFVHRFII